MVKSVEEIEGFGPVPSRREKGKDKEKPKQAARPRQSTASIQNDIAALLVYSNLMLAPVLKGDVMDDVEIVALSRAIDDQAKKSPRFRAAIQRMLAATGGTGLIGVSIMILGRRLARHGMIAPQWDANLGQALAVSQMSPAEQTAFMEQQIALQMQAMAEAAAAETSNGTEPAGYPPQSGPTPAEAPRPGEMGIR